MNYILGISAFFHDSAAALLKNGEIVGACQEERFSRIKHDSSFPELSIKYLLKNENISLNEINNIVFYDKPFLKFERLLETYLTTAPFGFKSFYKSIPIWLKEKLFLKRLLNQNLNKISKSNYYKKIKFSEHHLSHASSAYFPSPFNEAIVLTIDGVGEWATTTISLAKKNEIKILKEINFPHSLGLLYSAFTYYLGFKVNSGEYKMMGLAPYGVPQYKNLIYDNLINVKDDGSFILNQKYFDYLSGLTMINTNFENLFSNKKRSSEQEELNQFHMDIAASIQEVIEEIVLKILNYAVNLYKIKNLCIAGGVALNCVLNGKILKNTKFEKLWIQPASGDAGGSLGAALSYYYIEQKNIRKIDENYDSMKGGYLGPRYNDDQITSVLENNKLIYSRLNDEDLIEKVAKLINDNNVIGWFQDRMEFGPRALGNRSILANPMSKDMQKQLNLKVKFRESFRPFAPSILEEEVSNWFKLNNISPYMLIVDEVLDKIKYPIKKNDQNLFGIDKLNVVRSKIPAVTHVDYSARIQTVSKKTNKKYYNLIKKFKDLSDCPILINTSFNIRSEPIVCDPSDAVRCFLGTDIDVLVIENFLILKKDQKNIKINKYIDQFELD